MGAISSRSGAKPFSRSAPIHPAWRDLHGKVDPIRHLLDRGLIIDSPDIGAHKLPDGRYQLYLKSGFGNAAPTAAPSPPPTPVPALGGTYTEFYCQSGGSNLNSGSTTSNTAVYTSTNGNWNQGTRVFTPTDGSTPASSIAVGDFVSVFLDAATVGVYIARVTAVAAGVNGAITVDASANAGASPTTGVTGRTLKAGGAWKGPNAAVTFPFNITPAIQQLKNVAGNIVRLNLKNDATYTTTTTVTSATGAMMIQGYTTTPGDGGFATFDNGTTAAIVWQSSGTGATFANLIFVNAATTGTSSVASDAFRNTWVRCIAHGGRGVGFNLSNGIAIECEAYACNKSNSAGSGGFNCSASGFALIRCYSHDNTGSNTDAFQIQAPGYLHNCIADTCGRHGVGTTGSNTALVIDGCDFYKMTGDGINIISSISPTLLIENCNFIKNTGAAINNASANVTGFVLNCGYGSGSQANGAADTLKGLQQSGTIIYASGATPYSAPASGNFTVALADAQGTGRGLFIETGNSKTGTIGTPNIGAA